MRVYIGGMTGRPVSCRDCRLKLKGYCLLQDRNRGHKTQQEQYMECPLTEDDTAAGRSQEEMYSGPDKKLQSVMQEIGSISREYGCRYMGKRQEDDNKIYVIVDEDDEGVYYKITDDYGEFLRIERNLKTAAEYVLSVFGGIW